MLTIFDARCIPNAAEAARLAGHVELADALLALAATSQSLAVAEMTGIAGGYRLALESASTE